jgi:hypothetical protein
MGAKRKGRLSKLLDRPVFAGNGEVLEPGQVFCGVDEPKNHVSKILGIGVERVNPILISNRVRIPTQITKVLHGNEAAIEKLSRNQLSLDYLAKQLCPALAGIKL